MNINFFQNNNSTNDYSKLKFSFILERHIVNSHASIVLLHTNNTLTRVSESGHFEVTGKILLH